MEFTRIRMEQEGLSNVRLSGALRRTSSPVSRRSSLPNYGIGTVSQDDRFFIFSSDWMGTLGSQTGRVYGLPGHGLSWRRFRA